MLPPPFCDASAAAEVALNGPELGATHARLVSAGFTEDATWALINRVTEDPTTWTELRALHADVLAQHPDTPPQAVERVLLLRGLRRSIRLLPELRVADSVKRLLCEHVPLLIAPSPVLRRRCDIQHNSFIGLCKLSTLRRFPAGQLTWEISGIPRSWLLKVPPRDVLKVWRHVVVNMRGLAPMFVPHLSATRKDRAALLERESNRAYYRMAQSLALQTAVKGLIASSWLHSPETIAVSPHLLSFSRVLIENGAVLTTIGPADPDCGVFYRSPERKQAYDEGRFRPTTGLVLWARTDMLAWAAAHPELAS
jgi:hypothetical protein